MSEMGSKADLTELKSDFLCPQKQTQRGHRAMSEKCQKPTSGRGRHTAAQRDGKRDQQQACQRKPDNRISPWLRECERCRTSSSRSCNALDRRRQGAPGPRLRQARWAASLHKMRRCGSGAFDVRYTLNSGAKSNVAGCPSWV
jgi:hypothetical protein